MTPNIKQIIAEMREKEKAFLLPLTICQGEKSDEIFINDKTNGRVMRLWNGRSKRDEMGASVCLILNNITAILDYVGRLEKKISIAIEALELVDEGCRESDWICPICNHDPEMAETDIYFFTKRALEEIKAMGEDA